ncbi:L-arabinose isomerase [Anaerosacchariphilus polymeriproducens]|uniref:L-arabinose isomerase n=1 Tax=Anaerosacchariphilus polymeriproducens TaxID=1812858 RepID=A0A371ASU4_9FIRM|nr:L-arabinose isomerase [Anaerosacchariphilus polymeriproducens]RDU22619.1 L-arabinose isomerase [Anaerosacchariphilus polymeriproducens]
MKTAKKYKFWFCTGSQDLYGDMCLRKVAEHAAKMVEGLNQSGVLPFEVILKPTLISQTSIRQTLNDANNDEECAGVITWMHTFSPAKMWIIGLQEYKKPLCHLHTQFNEAIPYDSIDMDFMNENQSAHGDREYGHIVSRMGIERKIIVGHWAKTKVQEQLANWMLTAVGVMESSHIRVCRFGDNMNNVAVTEGDKVEAQIKFGWEVDHYNVNDVVEYVNAVSPSEVNALMEEYESKYQMLFETRDPEEFKRHVAAQAQIEIGMEKFLEERDYHAVVTHFGMLGGLKQLPGLAIQRLMEKGYGFGGEGDWKTAAMVRLMKIMTQSVKNPKGTSFMEDYTYHLVRGKEGILQSHMLEVCPTIAEGPISIKVNPLTMGNREDPARLVFTSKTGPGIATSLIDLGNRFRLIINAVDCKKCEHSMPNLPVATAFWTPQPNLEEGAKAWIMTGGAHHTAFSYDLTVEQMVDWADVMGIESVVIDKNTRTCELKKELRWNNMYYK